MKRELTLIALSMSITTQAQAATIGTLPPNFTDQDFQQMISTSEISEIYVVENRAGNNALNGDREIGINTPTGIPLATGQKIWEKGKAVNFSLKYDINSDTVTYEVEGVKTITAKVLDKNPTGMFIRTRATGVGDSTNELSGLELRDGKGTLKIGGQSTTATSGTQIDYIAIKNLTTSFELTGKQSYSWDPTFLLKSNNATQFKVVYGQATESVPLQVPESDTVVALLAGSMITVAAKRRAE